MIKGGLRFYFLLLIGLLCTEAKCQLEETYSVLIFDQFFKTPQLQTPAHSTTDLYDYKLFLSNRAYTGLFQGVNRVYVDLDVHFNGKKNNLGYGGLQFLSEKEGPLFTRNRIYGRYSQGVLLSSNLTLFVGVSAGLVSQTFGASKISAGGSSNAFDLNVGGSVIINKNTTIGVSYQQITRALLQPLSQVFYLEDYFTVLANHTFQINRETFLSAHAMYSQLTNRSDLYQVAVRSVFLKNLEVFAGLKSSRGYYGGLGLYQIEIRQLALSLGLSYLISPTETSYYNNVLEINVSVLRIAQPD